MRGDRERDTERDTEIALFAGSAVDAAGSDKASSVSFCLCPCSRFKGLWQELPLRLQKKRPPDLTSQFLQSYSLQASAGGEDRRRRKRSQQRGFGRRTSLLTLSQLLEVSEEYNEVLGLVLRQPWAKPRDASPFLQSCTCADVLRVDSRRMKVWGQIAEEGASCTNRLGPF